MSTSLSQYKTQLTAAQSTYLAGLQTMYGALVDLEALAMTVEKAGGGPQAHFSNNSMDAWQDLFTLLEHPTAAPRGSHFGGTLTANGATLTSSPTLHVSNVPAWVVAGLIVTDATSGAAIGTVSSAAVNGNSITLVANAANAVNSGDVLTFSFGASGRIREKINASAASYIANWSGS